MKKRIVVAIAIALMACTVTGCGSSARDEYANILRSGREKEATGGKMTKQEYDAVKSFNDWKSKQGEKTYNDCGG